jgi:hypothetical protein
MIAISLFLNDVSGSEIIIILLVIFQVLPKQWEKHCTRLEMQQQKFKMK